MIPFDFVYCRPDSLEEAAEAYSQMKSASQNPVYYSGGSEIITMCRAGAISPGAVIDIKAIPECNELRMCGEKLVIGSCNTLNRIKESKIFPLLGKAGGRVADHTNQCRITLGGNLCGSIIYRETSLPLMLCDAQVLLYGPGGARTEMFSSVFDKRMLLNEGEFVVHVKIPAWALEAPFIHVKKTTNEKIDYPLVNVTALSKDGALRVAFSGICAFPFRSMEIERVLGDTSATPRARVEGAAALLPEPAHSDVEGSGEYRLFVMKNTLLELLEEQSHGKI